MSARSMPLANAHNRVKAFFTTHRQGVSLMRFGLPGIGILPKLSRAVNNTSPGTKSDITPIDWVSRYSYQGKRKYRRMYVRLDFESGTDFRDFTGHKVFVSGNSVPVPKSLTPGSSTFFYHEEVEGVVKEFVDNGEGSVIYEDPSMCVTVSGSYENGIGTVVMYVYILV